MSIDAPLSCPPENSAQVAVKAVKRPKVAPTAEPQHPLVGKAFHIFGKDHVVSRQGYVVAQVDAQHFLVRWFEWVIGQASTLSIVPLMTMVVANPDDGLAEGSWQFYMNCDHMNDWYERVGQYAAKRAERKRAERE